MVLGNVRTVIAIRSTVVGGVVAALVALATLGVPSAARAEATESLTLPGGPTSATDPSPVQLDVDLYIPATTPAPAVILAHGFGGSQESVSEEAHSLGRIAPDPRAGYPGVCPPRPPPPGAVSAPRPS